MNLRTYAVAVRASKYVPVLIASTAALMLLSAASGRAHSQTSDKPAEPRSAEPRAPEVRQTFLLTNATQQFDLNDIQTDMRNMLPRARVYGVASENAISVAGSAEEIQLAQKIISDLDRPKKVYRLTYVIAEFDSAKRTGSEQYSLIVIQGERSELKQGTRVPIVTGTFSHDNAASESQTQFVDVGLSIEAKIEGARLHSKIERSSVSEEKSGVGPQDPIIRQTVLNGMTILPLGKPLVLGTIDVPGTTRRQEVEVSAEPVP